MHFNLRITWIGTRQVGHSYNYNYAAALIEKKWTDIKLPWTSR